MLFVPVFYDPRNPEDAVLEKQSCAGLYAVIRFFGSSFLALGLLIFFNIIRL